MSECIATMKSEDERETTHDAATALSFKTCVETDPSGARVVNEVDSTSHSPNSDMQDVLVCRQCNLAIILPIVREVIRYIIELIRATLVRSEVHQRCRNGRKGRLPWRCRWR